MRASFLKRTKNTVLELFTAIWFNFFHFLKILDKSFFVNDAIKYINIC